MLSGNLNATRFAQKPLPQPAYNFSSVPKPEPDLRGSALQFVDNDRDAFHACMAEMLLLCKEAMRRRRTMKRGTGSKPLSLEYLADRFDVDDPVFGFLVRTAENTSRTTPNNRYNDRNERFKAGMLQGFVTVTTFTNYQKSFMWDSHNEAAFALDDEDLASARADGTRKWDSDASLSTGMQATVRCGDIWNEGIVWPRIAEISLLGGLGCGRTLVSLVIEHLECMKASGKCNYDYVVLQATDNSVSFYESMGFVRVGAVAKEEKVSGRESTGSASTADSSFPSSSSSEGVGADESASASAADTEGSSPVARTRSFDIVTSEITSFAVKKAGDTVGDVAKKCNVDVWDIIFLNKDIFPDIAPRSRLIAGTVLHVPVSADLDKKPAALLKKRDASDITQWHVAKENETPKSIARKLNLSCSDLVRANKGRLEGLLSSSRLKAGTRIKISHLDVIEEGGYKPYAHWSFPDDQFEDGEPSYMMALKLNRRRGALSKHRPFLESLAVPMSDYQPTALVVPPSPEPVTRAQPSIVKPPQKQKQQSHPDEPKPPKRPLSSYMMFLLEQRELRREEFEKISVMEGTRVIAQEWHALDDSIKKQYEGPARAAREKYAEDKARYQKELNAFRASQQQQEQKGTNSNKRKHSDLTDRPGKHTLYNKVVRLKPGAMTEGSEYTYWYVSRKPSLPHCA